LIRNQGISLQKKRVIMGGIICWFTIAAFGMVISRAEDSATGAIIEGDFNAYQRAVRLRIKGSVDDDLWLAARWGRKEFVEKLLERGANPNARFSGEGTAILKAVEENLGQKTDAETAEIIRILKANGATNNPH
jgi:hypothetical protein